MVCSSDSGLRCLTHPSWCLGLGGYWRPRLLELPCSVFVLLHCQAVRTFTGPGSKGLKSVMVAVKPEGSVIILDVQVVRGSAYREQTWRAENRYDNLQQLLSRHKEWPLRI